MRVLSVNSLALVLLLSMSVAMVYADQRNLDYPHNSAKGYACDSCHYALGTQVPAWITAGINENDLGDTRYNKLCWGCHNDVRATFMPTHSNQSDQAVAKYGAKWSLECRVCHWPHHQKQTRTYTTASYLKSGTTTLVGTNYIKTGTVLVEDALIGNILIPNTSRISFQYKIIDNTTDTITVSPNLDPGVVSVGNTFAVIYGKLIKSTIKTPNSGDKAVRFFGPEGTNSFVDGDTTRDGVCEVCHTKTTHYRNDGTGSSQSHENIGGKNGSNCVVCHKHENGFKHGATGGQACGDLACHGGSGSHAGHLTDAGLACTDCHSANIPNFKDGGTSKDNTTVCADCHHDGTVVATGVKVLVSPQPTWGVDTITCAGCHASGPSYANGSPKANSHAIHAGFTCNKCHSQTTTNGTAITTPANHTNNAYNLQGGAGVIFSYAFTTSGGVCSNISCHGGTSTQWGWAACRGCHGVAQGSRAPIGPQFAGNSHHVQGVMIKDSHCYQCHWEAKSDGTINPTYHGGSQSSGSPVDLVLYGAGIRPVVYVGGGTAIAYTAGGGRAEIAKINGHCISCHRDQNNDTEPFGDCNTPRQYAWDLTSIDARYSQSSFTSWGKYFNVDYVNVAEKSISKAYSAHGNAPANQGGFSTTTGVDNVIPNKRAGSQNVFCFDCHNAHGSLATGITSSYKSSDGNQSGALLKSTYAGKGGYVMTYTPIAKSNSSNHNPYNPGAALCFDCHMTQNAVTTPWGYQQTFGATAPVLGYRDMIRFGTGLSGTQQRFSYRAGRTNQGGHLMASSPLKGLNGIPNSGDEAVYPINGLCTPCHDPHGVSPTLGSNQAYGVPLLKGTWLTSPYREDSPNTFLGRGWWGPFDTVQQRHWNTDRVTFGPVRDSHRATDTYGGITENGDKFAGLCLRCHPKERLTNSNTNPKPAWKSVDRIHETVKGWGTNAEHNFPCSKCHIPHNSGLPRLMATNCLNANHRGNHASGGNPDGYNGHYPGVLPLWDVEGVPAGCHETGSAAGGGFGAAWPENEVWNNVTPW